jgi:hypothetical protein
MDISLNFSSQIRIASHKKVLNKPFKTPEGPTNFAVYVKNEDNEIVKVNFGPKGIEINTANKQERKDFRIRNQCDTNPGPRWNPQFWECKLWEPKQALEMAEGSIHDVSHQWCGTRFWNQDELLKTLPSLAEAKEVNKEELNSEEYELNIAQLDYVRDYAASLMEKIKAGGEIRRVIARGEIQDKIFLLEACVGDIDALLENS